MADLRNKNNTLKIYGVCTTYLHFLESRLFVGQIINFATSAKSIKKLIQTEKRINVMNVFKDSRICGVHLSLIFVLFTHF